MQQERHLILIWRLWKNLAQRRHMQLFLLIVLMILAAFSEVVSIGAVLPFLASLAVPEDIFHQPIIQPVIELLNLKSPEQLLFPFTVIFVLGAVLSGFMRILLLWSQTRLSHAIGADFSIGIYKKTLYQPYSVHLARNSSEVISAVSAKASYVVNNTIMPLLTMLSSALILIFVLVALLSIEPVVAISALMGFASIYVIVTLVTRKSIKRDGAIINKETNNIIKLLQEGLGSIRDVLVNGTQATYCDLFRSSDLPLRKALANVSITSSCPRPIIEALGTVLIAVLAYFLAVRSDGISNAIPILGGLALGAQRLLPILQQGYSAWTVMQGGQASLAETLLLLEQEIPEYVNDQPVIAMKFDHQVELKDVAFKYDENSMLVLKPGFTLSIKKGSCIGLIGKSGSGKSTILDLLMGLLQPTFGYLEVDGIKIDETNCHKWQARIAHVPQTIFLTDSSIEENIALGVPSDQIDKIKVREAAEKAQISATIESMPNGYETLAGEKGVSLSGGQRQRIGIARALYKHADVIILDEATSALDMITEDALIEVLASLGNHITLIIVAHRLTTLKICTQVIEVDEGQIIRQGSYQNIVT